MECGGRVKEAWVTVNWRQPWELNCDDEFKVEELL
jgi:hypothetical protein